jgi:hypothetical protein
MTVYEKIFAAINAFSEKIRCGPAASSWKKSGMPVPPPHQLKQRIIAEIQKQTRYQLLIETGTYLGDMVAAQRRRFKQIYSIELGEDLYAAAVQKFARYPHIKILQGDSSDVLPKLMPGIIEPAIFWLDGHYSEGITAKGRKLCPIYEELNAIFDAEPLPHVLLIDDARLFNGNNDYPKIADLTAFIQKKRPGSAITTALDVFKVYIH